MGFVGTFEHSHTYRSRITPVWKFLHFILIIFYCSLRVLFVAGLVRYVNFKLNGVMIKVLLVLFRRTCGHVDVCMYVCIYFISQAQDVSQMPYYEKYITISQLYSTNKREFSSSPGIIEFLTSWHTSELLFERFVLRGERTLKFLIFYLWKKAIQGHWLYVPPTGIYSLVWIGGA